MATDQDRQFLRDALGRYREPLLRFAVSLVGWSQAPDLVQDTFLALCKAPRHEVEQHLGPWLLRVCKNRAIDWRREQVRLAPLAEDETSPESGPSSSAERRQTLSSVQRVVAELPAQQQQALVLKFSAGLSYKEIAEVMELSVTNVGFILHTAVKQVRERLAALAEPAEMRNAL